MSRTTSKSSSEIASVETVTFVCAEAGECFVSKRFGDYVFLAVARECFVSDE
jgi:hypothetical protein